MMVITDVNKGATGKYENRACIIAGIQDSLGSYYVMEISPNKEQEFAGHLQEINANKLEYNGCILWTNAGELIRTAKENNTRTMPELIREGTRRQVRYREWEEDRSNWVMYVDSLGQYWDEVSGERLDEEGVKKARREEMEEVYKHEVYHKVPIEECWSATGKNL